MAKRRLIYVDLAYTLRIVRDRHHEDFWHARHSGDYFPMVWGIHPIADVPDSEIRRDVRVTRFSPRQLVIEGTSQAAPWPRALLPLNFLVSQIALLRSLLRHARKRKVDAVFVTDPLYAGLFGGFLARRLNVPLIVFVPAQFDEIYEATGALGNPRILRFRKVEQAVMRHVFSHAAMVYAAAQSVADLARKYGAPAESIELLSHGKFVSSHHLRHPAERDGPDAVLDRYNIAPARRFIIHVGRLNPVKHPDDALRAMKIVLDAEPDIVGIMAGEGEMMASLKALAAELGIAERVAFPGLIDQVSLSRLLPHAVTLSPLTGMALIEASLAGSPVVAYDRDWQAQFVRNDDSGFVVPFRDIEAMAQKALQILRDPVLHERMAKAARQYALDFTDLERNRQREHAAMDAMFERWEGKQLSRH